MFVCVMALLIIEISVSDKLPTQLVYGCLPSATSSKTDKFLEAICSVKTKLIACANSKLSYCSKGLLFK